MGCSCSVLPSVQPGRRLRVRRGGTMPYLSLASFEMMKIVGKGGFGTVNAAQDHLKIPNKKHKHKHKNKKHDSNVTENNIRNGVEEQEFIEHRRYSRLIAIKRIRKRKTKAKDENNGNDNNIDKKKKAVQDKRTTAPSPTPTSPTSPNNNNNSNNNNNNKDADTGIVALSLQTRSRLSHIWNERNIMVLNTENFKRLRRRERQERERQNRQSERQSERGDGKPHQSKSEKLFCLHLFYAFQNTNYLFIAMPFMAGGDLRYHLSKAIRLSEKHVVFYAAQMLLGLKFLHDQNILYLDMKPDNVMLDQRGNIKLTDFGLSTILPHRNATSFGCVGTVGYQPPEMLSCQSYSFDADYWAFGIMVYELLHGVKPWRSSNFRHAMRRMFSTIAGFEFGMFKNMKRNAAQEEEKKQKEEEEEERGQHQKQEKEETREKTRAEERVNRRTAEGVIQVKEEQIQGERVPAHEPKNSDANAAATPPPLTTATSVRRVTLPSRPSQHPASLHRAHSLELEAPNKERRERENRESEREREREREHIESNQHRDARMLVEENETRNVNPELEVKNAIAINVILERDVHGNVNRDDAGLHINIDEASRSAVVDDHNHLCLSPTSRSVLNSANHLHHHHLHHHHHLRNHSNQLHSRNVLSVVDELKVLDIERDASSSSAPSSSSQHSAPSSSSSSSSSSTPVFSRANVTDVTFNMHASLSTHPSSLPVHSPSPQRPSMLRATSNSSTLNNNNRHLNDNDASQRNEEKPNNVGQNRRSTAPAKPRPGAEQEEEVPLPGAMADLQAKRPDPLGFLSDLHLSSSLSSEAKSFLTLLLTRDRSNRLGADWVSDYPHSESALAFYANSFSSPKSSLSSSSSVQSSSSSPCLSLDRFSHTWLSIASHPFFRHIDWSRVSRHEYRPPFRPSISDGANCHFNHELEHQIMHEGEHEDDDDEAEDEAEAEDDEEGDGEVDEGDANKGNADKEVSDKYVNEALDKANLASQKVDNNTINKSNKKNKDAWTSLFSGWEYCSLNRHTIKDDENDGEGEHVEDEYEEDDDDGDTMLVVDEDGSIVERSILDRR